MDIKKEFRDSVSLKDKDNISKVGLHGYVKIEVEDPITKERSLWYENDNIIPISGMQYTLMKLFGLHLDSKHDVNATYEDIGQDTSTVIPDLNESTQLNIGLDPESQYTPMDDDISASHFIQGFIVGNQGSGEDAISTKNTDYSFIKLRNPIPFQSTTDSLDPSLAGKYLGVYRQSQAANTTKKYFIKKFDERAHIYHNWWRDGQKWDYIDPVTQNDLGPAPSETPKTNRIETYAEVTMSIDTKNGDCLGYFENEGNNQSPVINELGLVAFDTIPGSRSIAEKLYNASIKKFLNLVYGAPAETTSEYDTEVITLAGDIATVLRATTWDAGQSNINEFTTSLETVSAMMPGSVNYTAIRDALGQETNITVQAYYNQSQEYAYEVDRFLGLLTDEAFDNLTVDEAQRIKMITYYTFKSIPLQSNWKIIISYRIYGN